MMGIGERPFTEGEPGRGGQLVAEWWDTVNCVDVDPELFFDEHQEAAARKVCAACPAIAGCSPRAVDHLIGWKRPSVDVYGGRSRRPVVDRGVNGLAAEGTARMLYSPAPTG
jgi:hypothetical protein